jgi:hypothetical protein
VKERDPAYLARPPCALPTYGRWQAQQSPKASLSRGRSV